MQSSTPSDEVDVELAEVDSNFESNDDDDDDDKREPLRGTTLRRLNDAKSVGQVHRSLARRPINAVAKLIKEGYIEDLPIDGKLLRSAEATLGKPYMKLKSKAAKRKTSRLKLYDRLIDGHIAIEFDVTTFYRRLLLAETKTMS